ncbi:MAG: class I tRNA ligase family protein, partial [Myxococcales bacterium]
SFYLDVTKDRLYCDPQDGDRRRSCQATVDMIARGTIAALAPITAFTADEAWRCLPGHEDGSVFLEAKLQAPEPGDDDAELLAAGEALLDVRDTVNMALEPKVKAKELGHRREVAVALELPDALRGQLGRVAPDLAEVFGVASVQLRSGDAVRAEVGKTSDARCDRCWRHRPDVGSIAETPELCGRCASVLSHQA